MANLEDAFKLQVTSDFDINPFENYDKVFDVASVKKPNTDFQPIITSEIDMNSAYALYDKPSEYITDHKSWQVFIQHLKTCEICLHELRDVLSMSSSEKEGFDVGEGWTWLMRLFNNFRYQMGIIVIGVVFLFLIWKIGTRYR